MFHTRQDLAFGCPIALQFIGDDHAWAILEPFAKLPKKPFCCVCVTANLYQNIQEVGILVYGPPEVVFLPANSENYLIHVPFVAATRATTTQFIGINLPKLQTPLSNRFIGDDDPALGQQFLDVAKTEGEAEIQPDSMTDNFRWEAKAFVIGRSGGCFHAAILTHCSALFPS